MEKWKARGNEDSGEVVVACLRVRRVRLNAGEWNYARAWDSMLIFGGNRLKMEYVRIIPQPDERNGEFLSSPRKLVIHAQPTADNTVLPTFALTSPKMGNSLDFDHGGPNDIVHFSAIHRSTWNLSIARTALSTFRPNVFHHA